MVHITEFGAKRKSNPTKAKRTERRRLTNLYILMSLRDEEAPDGSCMSAVGTKLTPPEKF